MNNKLNGQKNLFIMWNYAKMKKYAHDPDAFEVLPLLSNFASAEGLSLTDSSSINSFVELLTKNLREHVENDARLYGFRTQAMFAYIVAALGQCLLITQEDAGLFFAQSSNLRRPDFRIILDNGQQLLVEVKNYHQNDPVSPYEIRPEYTDSLKQYASTMGIPLMYAIFWSRWNIWTPMKNSKSSNNFFSASKHLL